MWIGKQHSWRGWLFICLISLSFWGEKAYAQDPEFTQFYANPLYLNPAFAGTGNCPRVNLNYRNQWPALTGSFVTTSASYDQHIPSIYGGLGLLITNDQAGKGTLSTSTFSGMYSYQLQINRQFAVRAGFQATFFQKKLDWNKLTFGDQIDPRRGFIYQTNDTPRGEPVQKMDFSAGILGFSDQYYFGFAAHHLTQPDESLILGESRLPIKFTGHAGAVVPIHKRYRNDGAELSPNILFQMQGDFIQLNMGLYVTKGPLVGGLWWRKDDSFITLIGFEAGLFKFGYSYDITVSRLANATAGSHELSTTIQFDCQPKRRRFKTVSCPSF